MSGVEIFLVIVGCAVASVIIYSLWLLENDRDRFREKHGVKPNYYSCATKGDMYCNHTDWCDAEIALFPEQYEEEMKNNKN
jgi:hypothetical protein